MKINLECAVWEITLECNLNCSHCGSSAGRPRPDELSTTECFRLCEELADLNCRNVALMGGEPFLRKDWLSVGQCIRDLGMELSIVSNGINLKRHLDDLVRLEPKVVGISLDGMMQSHEEIRGKGTWDKTVESIDLLRDRGIQTTVITTISQINFKDLPDMRELLEKKEVNWQLQIAAPFGNFKKEKMVLLEEFYAVGLFIAKNKMDGPARDFPIIGAHCFGYFSKSLPQGNWEGCTAGISSVGITSNGDITGCLAIGYDSFIEGSIRGAGFKTIWECPDNFSYNRRFDKKSLGNNCNNCNYAMKCKGGCSSISFTTTNVLHNDPYCYHRIEKGDFIDTGIPLV